MYSTRTKRTRTQEKTKGIEVWCMAQKSIQRSNIKERFGAIQTQGAK